MKSIEANAALQKLNMSEPTDVQQYLRLLCSEKDKWTLLYMGAVLHCDGPILEAVAWLSMLHVALKKKEWKLRLMAKIRFLMLTLLEARIGVCTTQRGTTVSWDRQHATLFLETSEKDNVLWYRGKGIVVCQSIRLCVKDTILLVKKDPVEKAQPFKPGEFDSFVETTVSTMLALSA